MQFDSFLFIAFLSAVIFLYYAMPSWRLRKGVLLGASYLFYAAWSPPLVILIWISTLTDYFIARQIFRSHQDLYRKMLLLVSLAVNLGLLGYFKYAQFLLDSFVHMVAQIGIVYQAPDMDIILPIGISFYTFQTISYTIDVYRRQHKPDHGLLDFSLYVTFFPQLVAGPIVRAGHFLPQCDRAPKVQIHEIAWGLTLLLFGLFAKIVLADIVMAPVADQVFYSPADARTLDAWFGMFAFSGQIFFDFSGYSLCALGIAMILGFALPDNFRSPYAAIGFSDFWERWHISLSSWMRDYLYISMGGNRNGSAKTFRNLMFTMFLGGLWHGASWNFVIWGGLHGLYLTAEHGLIKVFGGRFTGAIYQTFVILLTFILVTLAWIPFRAANIHDSLTLFSHLFTLLPGSEIDFNSKLLVGIVISATLGWHAYTRSKTLEERWIALPVWLRISVLMSMVLLIGICSTGDSRAFIYFQF